MRARRLGRAGVCAMLLTLCSASLAASQTTSPRDSGSDQVAREHFTIGREHYEAGRYAAAAAEFDASYRLSRRPELLFNAYLAHRHLGSFRQAADALRGYLAAAPHEPRARELHARVRQLEAAARDESAAPEHTGIDDAARRLPSYVAGSRAASTRHESASAGAASSAQHATSTPVTPVTAAASYAAAGARPRDEWVDGDDEAPSLVAPLVLAGVGVGALVSAAILQQLAHDTRDDLQRLCPNKDCTQRGPAANDRAQELEDRGSTYVTVSYVLFAVSAASLGVGAGLYLKNALGSDAQSAGGSRRLGFACGPDRCLATLKGTF